jgi:hypothetical protein
MTALAEEIAENAQCDRVVLHAQGQWRDRTERRYYKNLKLLSPPAGAIRL